MTPEFAAIRRELVAGGRSDLPKRLAAAFRTLPPAQVAAALPALAAGLNTDLLGQLVFPAMADRLESDDAFFDAVANLATSRPNGSSPRFSYVLLDSLDRAARARGGRRRARYFALLRQIAVDDSLPSDARGKALRLLSRDAGSPETVRVLSSLVRSADRVLVNAAGHVVVTWKRTNADVPPAVAGALVAFARSDPRTSLRSPGILRALCEIQSPAASDALGSVAGAARSRGDRRSLLQTAGAYLSDQLFAAVVRGFGTDPEPEEVAVVRALVLRDPRRLEAIHDHGSDADFLLWLRHAPEIAATRAMRRRLETAAATTPVATAGAASTPVATARAAAPRMLPMNEAVRLAAPPLAAATAAPPLGAAFATGLQRADAMYKTLDWGNIVGNHWHAGIFNAFEGFADGRGKLSGLQATDDIFDTVHWFSADGRYFDSPHGTLEAPAHQLFADFLVAFGATSGAPYEGARTPQSAVPLATRKAIVDTAVALSGEGIDYTFGDMMDYRGTGWSGELADIDEIRCDGVVEFSYERQNVRVCGGKDPESRNQWNIAIRGKNHPQNHNDLHTWGYNRGELCPHIQAGDEANDSTFSATVHAVPRVTSFVVIPGYLGVNTPFVIILVDAPLSEFVWVRLRVRPKGASAFEFAAIEPAQVGISYGGPCRLQQIRANAATAFTWIGRTGSGGQYSGTNRPYEFRIQVIDQGGNVSDEKVTEATLTFA